MVNGYPEKCLPTDWISIYLWKSKRAVNNKTTKFSSCRKEIVEQNKEKAHLLELTKASEWQLGLSNANEKKERK